MGGGIIKEKGLLDRVGNEEFFVLTKEGPEEGELVHLPESDCGFYVKIGERYIPLIRGKTKVGFYTKKQENKSKEERILSVYKFV